MPLGSEVRQFGHSGMIAALINKGWNVVVAAKIVDEDIKNQLDSRIKLIPLTQERLPQRYLRVQELLDRSHQIIESRRGKKNWRYRPDPEKTLLGKTKSNLLIFFANLISRSPLLYRVLGEFEHNLEMEKVSPVWLKILREMQIDVVVVNVPRSDVLHSILIAAKALGIPNMLLYHTSKDVIVNGRLNHDYDAIGVWNMWMKSEIIHQNRPGLDPQSIQIIGCAHFDCVGRSDILLPEDDFRKLMGAKPGSRLILFPASAPWVVPDEARFVHLIAKAIETGILPKNIQIVVRTNPMDSSDYFKSEFLNNDRVLVQKANWRWEPKQNWAFQRYEDMVVYNSLLHYSNVCIGIPSTVTIECVISELPVINIGFDLPGPKPLPGSIRAFWEADFYQDIVQNNIAELAADPNDLLSKIRNQLKISKLDNSQNQKFISTILGVPPHHSSEKCIEIINQAVSIKE